MKINKYYFSTSKRIFDLTLSLFLLFTFLPIFTFFYPFLLIIIGKPIIFKQKRVGKNKKIFTIYKLRTMKNGSPKLQKKLIKFNEAPYPMFKITNDPRFHKCGKFLSKYGLDEVPQLINIIKNEMSFIGPRPLPVNETNKLDKSWQFRYFVKPGILSKWAISPKRHKSLDDWRKLDKIGIKIASLSLDITIIIKTIKIIIFKY